MNSLSQTLSQLSANSPRHRQANEEFDEEFDEEDEEEDDEEDDEEDEETDCSDYSPSDTSDDDDCPSFNQTSKKSRAFGQLNESNSRTNISSTNSTFDRSIVRRCSIKRNSSVHDPASDRARRPSGDQPNPFNQFQSSPATTQRTTANNINRLQPNNNAPSSRSSPPTANHNQQNPAAAAASNNRLRCLNPTQDTMLLEHQQRLYNLGYRAYFNPLGDGDCLIHGIMHRLFLDQRRNVNQIRYAIANGLYNETLNSSEADQDAFLDYIRGEHSDIIEENVEFKDILASYCNLLAEESSLFRNSVHLGLPEIAVLCTLLNIRVQLVHLRERDQATHQIGSAGPIVRMALIGRHYHLLIGGRELDDDAPSGFRRIEDQQLEPINQAINRISQAYRGRTDLVEEDAPLIAVERPATRRTRSSSTNKPQRESTQSTSSHAIDDEEHDDSTGQKAEKVFKVNLA